MDIDDILRDFEASGRHTPAGEDLYGLLVTAMLNERMAPEVLPYQHALLQQVLGRLLEQQQTLVDLHEYGDSNAGSGVVTADFKLHLMIIETEIERLNYLVRLYLRARLAKLDRHHIHYINAVAHAHDAAPLLSPQEVDYIHKHFKLLTQLYNSGFLKKLPHFLTLLDDTSGGQLMVEAPDVDQPVFVKVVTLQRITLRVEADEELELERGGIYVVRYRLVQHLVRGGDVELI